MERVMIVYHGTSGRAARDILRDMRVLVGVISRWGAKSRPMPRMYVTPELPRALSYARSGVVVGDDSGENFDNWAEGAVLKIDCLGDDVVPDEDWLGEWAPDQARHFKHRDQPADPAFIKLMLALTPGQAAGLIKLADVLGVSSHHSVTAPIGRKILMQALRRPDGPAILRELAARATSQAVAGTIRIVRAWTFDMHDYDGRVWQTPWESDGVDLDASQESHLDRYGEDLPVPDDVIPVMRAAR